MLTFGKIDNKFAILVLTILIITLIGFLDYMTGPELSFSFFYLFPISLISLNRSTKIIAIIICSVFSSFLWFLAEYVSRDYSNIFFPIWNGFVRLSIFTAIGLLLFYIKEKDKRLKLVNRDLKAINEEKNKFIGIAAHDLRSPASGISSLSDLLIDEYKDNSHPRALEFLQLIKTMSNNILILLKNLLDVSKIESGKVELNVKSQDYITFIKQQILLGQIIANRKNISIIFHSNIERIMVDFDDHYFSEVIDNLFSNAIKYSDNKSEVFVKISILDNNQILTEVIDKGKGIPEEEQKKLFNYFQTTSTKPTAGEQSTGLGLAIAKQIIKLHNGDIGVKSFQNQGSNFYFQIPIKKGY